MKRFFFWCVVLLALFILFFFGMNLFDSGPAPDSRALSSAAAAGDQPLADNLEPGNGFFVVWGFAEPPGTDLTTEAYGRQVQELFHSPRRGFHSRSRFGLWLVRLNTVYRQYWQGANFNFPQFQGEDVSSYFASRRAQVEERQERCAPLLQRYRQVLEAAELKDFTPLNRECPARSLLLATFAARLFAASQVLAALDGEWLAAAADLLEAAEAGFKLIASGRTLAVNSLGKAMVELSLHTLVSLINHPKCPLEFSRLVLDRMPEPPVGRFGTATVRSFNWLRFHLAISRVKRDKIVNPFLLKDYFREPAAFFALERFVAISGQSVFAVVHALAAFFLKENETSALLRDFWQRIGHLEETPPWRWGESAPQKSRGAPGLERSSPFWWLRNPLGKMMVRAAVPYTWPVLQHYVYRSHGLKVRYDLVRLLALARLQAGPAMTLDRADIQGLLAAAAERDPFSGKPYLFNPESGMLYSVGQDGQDNGSRERPAIWRDSDIAVPIQFVKSEK